MTNETTNPYRDKLLDPNYLDLGKVTITFNCLEHKYGPSTYETQYSFYIIGGTVGRGHQIHPYPDHLGEQFQPASSLYKGILNGRLNSDFVNVARNKFFNKDFIRSYDISIEKFIVDLNQSNGKIPYAIVL